MLKWDACWWHINELCKYFKYEKQKRKLKFYRKNTWDSTEKLKFHLPHSPSYIIIVEHMIIMIPYYHIWQRLNIDVVNVTVKFKCRINFVMSLVERILVFVSNVKFGSCKQGWCGGCVDSWTEQRRPRKEKKIFFVIWDNWFNPQECRILREINETLDGGGQAV